MQHHNVVYICFFTHGFAFVNTENRLVKIIFTLRCVQGTRKGGLCGEVSATNYSFLLERLHGRGRFAVEEESNGPNLVQHTYLALNISCQDVPLPKWPGLKNKP